MQPHHVQRVVTAAQLGGPLEPTLDDLYDDLRDSTDGDFHSARRKQGGQLQMWACAAPLTPACMLKTCDR